METLTGVVLAGGNGTRLRPLTNITNKHLLPVYDRPMIDYPIKTLREMGCDNIVIVSGGEHIGGFAEYLGDGFTYRIQQTAGGIAQALSCARGLVTGLFPVILGDNYFETAPTMPDKPTLYVKEVPDPNRYGVYANGKIVEKPQTDMGNQAVVGLYVFDERCFDVIDKLSPSDRGEYEVTDINNQYLEWGADVIRLSGHWSDMGTHDSLLDTANFIRRR